MSRIGEETWCVAGGGILGQALALRLAQAGKRVTICEASDETGGLAAAWTIDDIVWDKHYHVILPADSRTLSLIDEIGLGGELEWERSRTGFYAKGRLAPLNGAIDYLRLPTIGLIAKARIAFTLMMAARIRDGRPLEHVPVKEWLTKWSGRAAFDRLWRPLLRAKLGANDEIVSAAFIWATIRRLYLARSAGAKTETLGFVGGGYPRILTALRAHLEANGVEVVTSCPIRKVEGNGDQFRVVTGLGEKIFDRVVSTLPSGQTALLCDELAPDIRARLENVVYQGIICASLVLDRPLAGYYLTYLTEPHLPFTAVVEMSALTGTDRFGGRTLIYLPRYVTHNDAYWQLDDEELRTRFVAGLRSIYPDLGTRSIAAFRLSRVRNVMAVPTIGYSDVVPPVATNLDGFYVVNSAQITDGTLNVDATLGVVENALPLLLAGSSAKRTRSAA
jgi:protoporphyrinogen oxidase